MKKIGFIVFMFCYSMMISQAPSKFFQRFGGNGYDVAYDLKQTLDSGYIVAGSTSSFGFGNTDMYLAKLNKMGEVVFQKTFGDYNNETAKSVIQLSDSSYVILGYTNSFGVGGYDMYLVKVDKMGQLVWQKNYGGVDWDFGYSLKQTTDGGFIIAGTTYSFGRGNADGYVIKTDALGNVVWSKTFGGSQDDEFKSVIQTSDGGYALTGYTKSYSDITYGDMWVFKINALGDSTWCKFYGGVKEDFGNCIIEHPNGDYLIAGAKQSTTTDFLEAYALRINNSGTVGFQFLDNDVSNDRVFNSITISKRNSNIVTLIEKENFPGYNLQFKLLELNVNLFYLNATDYGSLDYDETFSIVATSDKGYAAVGYTKGYGAVLTDVYVVKTDSMLVGGNYSIVGISVVDKKASMIQAFPNPVKDLLMVKFEQVSTLSSISLYDSYGVELDLKHKVCQKSIQEIQIDVKDLTNGIYFLKIEESVKKIIVSH
jgi:hypothetical protein